MLMVCKVIGWGTWIREARTAQELSWGEGEEGYATRRVTSLSQCNVAPQKGNNVLTAYLCWASACKQPISQWMASVMCNKIEGQKAYHGAILEGLVRQLKRGWTIQAIPLVSTHSWAQKQDGAGGGGWVGLGEGLTWSPTHGPRRLPCRTRLGGCTRVSGHKAYRTVDRPQTPQWRSRAGDAAVPVCMCPCASVGGGGGCGTPACSIVVRRWRTWRGEVCAWCSRPRQGGWRA